MAKYSFKYLYDPNNCLTGVSDGQGVERAYHYDAAGNVVGISPAMEKPPAKREAPPSGNAESRPAYSQQALSPEWYLSRGGKSYGPYSWDELAGYARRGLVAPGDLVWSEQLEEWIPAGHIEGLLAE